MRRLLVIFVLFLLPIQFSWAAVAAYCGHESGHGSGQQVWHLGHHAHQHVADPSVDDGSVSTPNTAPAGLDFDCSHCHGTCASIYQPATGLVPLDLAAHLVPPIAGFSRTLAQSPPERPQWLALA